MPITRCVRNGKAGWKWGANGFCYTDAKAKEKAVTQGLAALSSEARANGAKSKEDIQKYIQDHGKEL